MNSEQYWISSENNLFSLHHLWKILIQLWTLLISSDPAMNIAGAETLHVRFKNTVKTSKLTPVTFFFPITGGILVSFLGFVLVKKSSDTESKENTVFGKNHIFRIFQNNPLKVIPKFLISRLFSINFEKKTLFLTFFMVFDGFLLASNVQRWIRDVQKCSSLNQLWPEMSKLKSAGSALNIAENAKISESALKMTEYLWELNPGVFKSNRNTRLPDTIRSQTKNSPSSLSRWTRVHLSFSLYKFNQKIF